MEDVKKNGHGNGDIAHKKNGHKRKSSKPSVLPTPPDGGWGWMVVVGSFFIHVVADGVAYSFGIFCVEFIDQFNAGRAEVGWIGSMMIGITWGSGPIASALTNRYGCRTVTIMGSVLASIGFIVSVFAPNIYFMYFSYGILGGLGLGLIYLPAIVSVTYYFEKRRSFATGLAVCGSGIGTFAFAPLTKFLVAEYGWKGASLISSAILLNCIACGALFRPLVADVDDDDSFDVEMEDFAKLDETSPANGVAKGVVANGDVVSSPEEPLVIPARKVASMQETFTSMPSAINSIGEGSDLRRHRSETLLHRVHMKNISSSPNDNIVRPMSRKDIFYGASLDNIPMYKSNPDMYAQSVCSIPSELQGEYEGEKTCCECSPEMKEALHQMTDFSLLRDPIFLLFAVSNFFTSIGFCVPYLYLPDKAQLMGMTENQGAFLISVIGIANTVGRIVFGWMSDRPCVNRLMLYNTALALCGLCTALSAFCNTFPLLAAYAASFGMFLGVYVSLTSVVLVDLLGLECLTNSFGITLLFQGVAGVIGTPIAGAVYDATGNYDNSFYLMGTIIGISGIMLYCIPCLQSYMERKHPKPNAQHDVDMGRRPTISQTDLDRVNIA